MTDEEWKPVIPFSDENPPPDASLTVGVSPEEQKAFVDDITRVIVPFDMSAGKVDRYRFVPERLCYIDASSSFGDVTRHFFLKGIHNYSHTVGHVIFNNDTKDGKYYPCSLLKYGEDRKQINLISFDHGRYGGRSAIRFPILNKEMAIQYGTDGNFIRIGSPVEEGYGPDGWTLYNTYSAERDEQSPSQISFPEGTIEVSVDKQAGKMTVRAIKEGKVHERLVIPLHISREDIIKTLFPPEAHYPEDPYTAEPADDDRTWLKADFLKAWGIERGLPPDSENR